MRQGLGLRFGVLCCVIGFLSVCQTGKVPAPTGPSSSVELTQLWNFKVGSRWLFGAFPRRPDPGDDDSAQPTPSPTATPPPTPTPVATPTPSATPTPIPTPSSTYPGASSFMELEVVAEPTPPADLTGAKVLELRMGTHPQALGHQAWIYMRKGNGRIELVGMDDVLGGVLRFDPPVALCDGRMSRGQEVRTEFDAGDGPHTWVSTYTGMDEEQERALGILPALWTFDYHVEDGSIWPLVGNWEFHERGPLSYMDPVDGPWYQVIDAWTP